MWRGDRALPMDVCQGEIFFLPNMDSQGGRNLQKKKEKRFDPEKRGSEKLDRGHGVKLFSVSFFPWFWHLWTKVQKAPANQKTHRETAWTSPPRAGHSVCNFVLFFSIFIALLGQIRRGVEKRAFLQFGHLHLPSCPLL